MIGWCAGVLDTGALGTTESSMTKVAVSEALFGVADRPYVDMLEEAAKTHAGIYDVLFGRRPAFRFEDPRFRTK